MVDADGAHSPRAGRRRAADPPLRCRQQYTSFDFTQELADHGVLGSIGSVGDAFDNAMAESFVDTLPPP